MSKYNDKRQAALTKVEPQFFEESLVDFLVKGVGAKFKIEFEPEGSVILSFVKRSVGDSGGYSVIWVDHSDIEELKTNTFVGASELFRLLDEGRRYRPNGEANPMIENRRAELFDFLFELSEDEGDEGGLTKFLEKLRKKSEEESRLQVASFIRGDLKANNLSSDPWMLFRTNRINEVGLDSGEHVYVFCSRYENVGGIERFVIRPVEAPLGVKDGVFEVGKTYTSVSSIFDKGGLPDVLALRSFILGLLPEDKIDELKELALALQKEEDKERAMRKEQNRHQQKNNNEGSGFLRRGARNRRDGDITMH